MTGCGRLTILLLGLLLLGAGCGEDGDGDGDGGDRPRETADRLPSERREAPPAGVAEQVEYFEIGNGTCEPASVPSIDFVAPSEKGVVEIGQTHHQICFLGFDPALPVAVTVTRPDGREVVRTVEPFEGAEFHVLLWEPLPGDPIGRYGITALQGETVVEGSFEVRRATSPRVRTVQRFVSPGDPVEVAFAGFPPQEAVGFQLYREQPADPGQYSFLASLTARMDANGEAVHEIETEPGTPRGNHLVRISDTIRYGFDIGEDPAVP